MTMVGGVEPAGDRTAAERGAEVLLRAIVDGTAATTRSRFFTSLVQHLATALQVRRVYVAECLDADRARARAVWMGHEFAQPFEYDVAAGRKGGGLRARPTRPAHSRGASGTAFSAVSNIATARLPPMVPRADYAVFLSISAGSTRNRAESPIRVIGPRLHPYRQPPAPKMSGNFGPNQSRARPILVLTLTGYQGLALCASQGFQLLSSQRALIGSLHAVRGSFSRGAGFPI